MIVLVCGVLASLALGLWLAYGLCIAMFGLFKMHARQMAAASETVARRATQRLGALGN